MEIQLSDLWEIFKKRFWLIFAITFLSVATIGWVSFKVLTPQYQATTTLLVQPKVVTRVSYDDLIANEKLVPTYGAIVKSKKIAADVIKRLNLPTTEEELLQDVEVTELKDSMVTEVTVTNPNPTQAVIIANGFAQSLKENLPKIMKVGHISTLDKAELNGREKPVSPKPFFNMAVVLLLVFNTTSGLFVISGILHKKVTSDKALHKILGKPILVRLIKNKHRRKLNPLYCLEQTESFMTESFRKLRTNILYMPGGQEICTLLITSALPKEGKTMLAINLAIAMAQGGKRVLLIDGNLRDSSIHKYFGVSNEVGLTTAIAKPMTDPVIYPTAQSNLHLFPGGPVCKHPAELLTTKEMAALLERLKQRYELILIDSASIIPVADAQVLAKLSDAVILVTKIDATSAASVLQAKELLTHIGANLVGAVANYQKINYKKFYPY